MLRLATRGALNVSDKVPAPGIDGLEAARAELETALSRNPHWRALAADADRATRERCERELGDDPVYRSWRAVNAAIESLRSANGAITPRGKDAADQATPGRRRDIELADILQAIRMDASARDSERPSAIAADEVQEAPDAPDAAANAEPAKPPAALPAQAEMPANGAAPDAEPTSPAAPDTGAAVPPRAAQGSRIPTVAASAHVNTEAAERAKRLEKERRRLRDADQMIFDAEEATVSFVIRERSNQPTASATPVATTVPAQPRQAARHARDNGGYVPHHSSAQAAEVVVVKHGNNGARIVESHLSKRGPMRRLMRSLTRS
jgi:hypothetical protein